MSALLIFQRSSRATSALMCFVAAFVFLAGAPSAEAKPLPENMNLDVKGILRHKDSSRFSLVRPKIRARDSYFPVHVSGGAYSPELISQAICTMVHPGLISVGFGTTPTQTVAVKVNDGGIPLSLFRPRSVQAAQVFGGDPGALVLSHVTCATHR